MRNISNNTHIHLPAATEVGKKTSPRTFVLNATLKTQSLIAILILMHSNEQRNAQTNRVVKSYLIFQTKFFPLSVVVGFFLSSLFSASSSFIHSFIRKTLVPYSRNGKMNNC